MRITRTSTVGAVAIAGALALSACGSDNTSTGGSGSGSSAGATAASNADCFSGQLNAEGSTAQKNAIEQAIKSFQTACGDATINYNATGSGAGIKQFTGGQVDFAGSDSALKESEQEAATKTCGSPAWDLPMVAGPIAVAYNVSGVDKLTLDATTIAKIFRSEEHTSELQSH